MPIYEFQCSACGHIFEVLTTSSNDSTDVQCSACRSAKVTKILSAGSFRLGHGTPLPAAAPSGCGNKSGFT
jgi:putative FmdB family regulatory protein